MYTYIRAIIMVSALFRCLYMDYREAFPALLNSVCGMMLIWVIIKQTCNISLQNRLSSDVERIDV